MSAWRSGCRDHFDVAARDTARGTGRDGEEAGKWGEEGKWLSNAVGRPRPSGDLDGVDDHSIGATGQIRGQESSDGSGGCRARKGRTGRASGSTASTGRSRHIQPDLVRPVLEGPPGPPN